MKIATLIFILTGALFAEIKPFGIPLGKVVPKSLDTTFLEGTGITLIRNPPKPIKGFKSYAIELVENKIMTVLALGKTHENDDYCFSSQSQYDNLEKILLKKYGTSADSADRLAYDTIWEEAKYYKMSLIKNERYHYTEWKDINGFSIELQEDANENGCYVIIKYFDDKLKAKSKNIDKQETMDSL